MRRNSLYRHRKLMERAWRSMCELYKWENAERESESLSRWIAHEAEDYFEAFARRVLRRFPRVVLIDDGVGPYPRHPGFWSAKRCARIIHTLRSDHSPDEIDKLSWQWVRSRVIPDVVGSYIGERSNGYWYLVDGKMRCLQGVEKNTRVWDLYLAWEHLGANR